MTGFAAAAAGRLLAGLLLGAGFCLGGGIAERCQAAREARGVVRILHFGDSHLAARETSQPMGDGFRTQFGDGGPGLGLPWVARQPGLAAQASRGWRRSRRPGSDGRIGLAAGFLETWRAGESAGFSGTFERFRLCLLTDPQGGKVAVSVDGSPAGEQDLCGPANQVAVFGRAPGPGPHRVELRVVRDGLVRVLGVAAERAAGAVYSPLAYNGARASWLLNLPEALFQAQLQAAAPDLVILAFGTNEANARDFDPDSYRQELEALLGRFQRAAPRAALLLVGPPDAFLHQGSAATLASVIGIQHRLAPRFAATFVDRQKLMGGPGAMEDWLRQGLANPDRVHLNAQGYPRLSRLLLAELFGGPAPAPPRGGLAMQAGAPVPGAPRPPAEAARPLYTFRRKEGGVFITDDPDKVQSLPGEWIREKSE
jgi:lysophospholipase L1-like esterase